MKDTWNNSKIDHIIDALRKKHIPFVVKVIGFVKATGENDIAEGRKIYVVRKLFHRNVVIIEQMIRVPDPDLSDIFTSFAFKKNEEPKEWALESESTEEEYDNTPNYYGM